MHKASKKGGTQAKDGTGMRQASPGTSANLIDSATMATQQIDSEDAVAQVTHGIAEEQLPAEDVPFLMQPLDRDDTSEVKDTSETKMTSSGLKIFDTNKLSTDIQPIHVTHKHDLTGENNPMKQSLKPKDKTAAIQPSTDDPHSTQSSNMKYQMQPSEADDRAKPSNTKDKSTNQVKNQIPTQTEKSNNPISTQTSKTEPSSPKQVSTTDDSTSTQFSTLDNLSLTQPSDQHDWKGSLVTDHADGPTQPATHRISSLQDDSDRCIPPTIQRPVVS